MVYKYEEQKPEIYTDRGIDMLMRFLKAASKKFKTSGAFRYDSISLSGDSWLHLAVVDYLVEIGDLKEIPTDGATQERIFVKGDLWDL